MRAYTFKLRNGQFISTIQPDLISACLRIEDLTNIRFSLFSISK